MAESMQQWLSKRPIDMRVLAGPYESRDDDGWVHDAYRLQLVWEDGAKSRRSPEFAYRMGIGHRVLNRRTQREEAIKEPPLDEVLDSLASDASAYDNARGFDDFAHEFGYDTDSRKAHALYEACGDVLKWLRELVGGEQEIQHLMYKVERV